MTGGGGGGAINFAFYGPNINILVADSVFELSEASNDGGAALINESSEGQVKVGWINNNEFIFGNTAYEECDDIFDGTSDTCASVGDNFSV